MATLQPLSSVCAQLPDSLREIQPLFLAVICGCNAGLLRAALHEVYIPRIRRGNGAFAPSKRWIAWIRFCRFLQAALNGMASSTTAMEPFHPTAL